MLPPPAAPAKPNPIDAALAALGEVAAELIASGRPGRFAELQRLSAVAQQVQLLRPPESLRVEDMGLDPEVDGALHGAPIMMGNPMAIRGGRWNDAADINTQMIMIAQEFLKKYADAELAKKAADSRMSAVAELETLMGLRRSLAENKEQVPEEINARVGHLLKKIGEPPHEPGPYPAVSPLDVRRHPPDGAGPDDGGRVGEPVA
jgi:hypothetical protein